MNPRRRRLLFPALLVVLLLVAAVVSFTRDAEGAEPGPAAADGSDVADAEVVSTVDDPRITESSGLVVSGRHDDLAYTVNDSGNDDVVYALRISTGEVVGTTSVEGTAWRDTEALTLHDGRLWIADIGDNQAVRDDIALYAIDEPGPGDHTATSERYPLAYTDGPHDAESLAVDADGRFVIATKELLSGEVRRLPAELSTDETNVVEDSGAPTLLLATDASTSPDGAHLLVRNYIEVAVLDSATLRTERTITLPDQPQGETIAFESGGESFLVGSEGSPWDLQRLGFSPDGATAVPTATPTPSATAPVPSAAEPVGGTHRWWLTVGVSGLAVALLAGVSAWSVRRQDD